MDDEVKLWFEFVSGERDEAYRMRRHGATLLFPLFGALIAAMLIIWNSKDWLTGIVFGSGSFFIILGIIGLILSNMNMTKRDKQFYYIQIKILFGILKNPKEIENEFRQANKNLEGFFQNNYNETVNLLDKTKL